MSKSTDKNSITPLGVAVCAIVICVLASLAVPRFIEASRPATPSAPHRVLAGFGGEVRDIEKTNTVVICKACDR